MSGPFRAPGNDPFQGGARFNLAPPTAGSGALAPPGGGVQNPLNVSAAGIKMARQNRGSNVQIPHARVVPLSPADTALPAIAELHEGAGAHPGRQRGGMLESETLAAGRIGFVLANRAEEDSRGSLNDAGITLTSFSLEQSRQSWTLWQRLGHGVDRTDRMCSFEYLERYFAVALKRVHVQLSDITVPNAAGLLADKRWSRGTRGRWIADPSMAANPPVTRIPDVANRAAEPTNRDGDLPMGIMAYDVHPFIRGKSLENRLFKVKDTAEQFVSRAAGDAVAIAMLEHEFERKGLLDWRPDGVVVGKEDSGQGSDEMDDAFDARLQQLFNVAVQGPAITTAYVGKRELQALPGDRVFVAIVCDRFWGSHAQMGGTLKLVKEPNVTNLQEFEAAREALFNQRNHQMRVVREVADNACEGGADATLFNFRGMLTTSSHMINSSGVKLPADPNEPWRPGKSERMGLKWGDDLAEYIVGGWCIGRVLDSAASRAALPGHFASNANPTSHSINIDVNVEWWSGDRMFRAYCDKEGKTFSSRNEPADHGLRLPSSFEASVRAKKWAEIRDGEAFEKRAAEETALADALVIEASKATSESSYTRLLQGTQFASLKYSESVRARIAAGAEHEAAVEWLRLVEPVKDEIKDIVADYTKRSEDANEAVDTAAQQLNEQRKGSYESVIARHALTKAELAYEKAGARLAGALERMKKQEEIMGLALLRRTKASEALNFAETEQEQARSDVDALISKVMKVVAQTYGAQAANDFMLTEWGAMWTAMAQGRLGESAENSASASYEFEAAKSDFDSMQVRMDAARADLDNASRLVQQSSDKTTKAERDYAEASRVVLSAGPNATAEQYDEREAAKGTLFDAHGKELDALYGLAVAERSYESYYLELPGVRARLDSKQAAETVLRRLEQEAAAAYEATAKESSGGQAAAKAAEAAGEEAAEFVGRIMGRAAEAADNEDSVRRAFQGMAFEVMKRKAKAAEAAEAAAAETAAANLTRRVIQSVEDEVVEGAAADAAKTAAANLTRRVVESVEKEVVEGAAAGAAKKPGTA